MGNTHRKNVVVVGAGASKEFGLPTGAELKNDIAKISDIRFEESGQGLVSGDYRLVDTLRELLRVQFPQSRNINRFLHAAWAIRDNMPLAPSIDNFLDTHRNYPELIKFGKIAISKAILEAESNSLLFVKDHAATPRLDIEKLKHTWIVQFFAILVAQRDFDDFIDALSSITFVSFNYDRCLHQFIAFAARDYFALDDEGVDQVLRATTIFYPYGTVGEFKWVDARTNFGKTVYGSDLLACASEIRTFTEGTGSEVVEQISNAFSEAEVVLFMGFGFLKLNMDLLFSGQRFPEVRVLATGKGMSGNSRSQVVSELEHIFPVVGTTPGSKAKSSNVDVLDMTCADLIFEFERYLSA